MPNHYAGSRGRLLLVEDHASTRLVLQRLLAQMGFDVCAVGAVAEAILAGEKTPFGTLVSDLGLPDGSGCDVILALKQ
ncbi:MAG TPA: response regulator, partial [Candidatus Synoicihabitans sp.]|nr:response regulator [Candidatus Synoicihabitans sp.]